ncbi:MAG: helix-turn-helix transcriptional regulator, partial [Clostridia bacterium]|nr:helix-turn-helix transcriptional regulator [Clostridia bacterium]
GLSQAELAKALNLTQRKISYLETGQFEPDLKILWDISNYFEVSCDYLIGKSEF